MLVATLYAAAVICIEIILYIYILYNYIESFKKKKTHNCESGYIHIYYYMYIIIIIYNIPRQVILLLLLWDASLRIRVLKKYNKKNQQKYIDAANLGIMTSESYLRAHGT